MTAFVIHRLITIFIVLLCVVSITFFLIRLTPGGPFTQERKLPPEA